MRKTCFCVILLGFLFSAFFICPAFAEKAAVVGSEVSVRTGPGPEYGFFASLDNGTIVEVVNRSNSDWYLVSWNGNSGYIAAESLEFVEENSAPSYTPPYIVNPRPETPGYITGMYVALRSGPATSYSILGTYNTGKTLMITGNSGEWAAVRIDGQEGFVYRDFVSEGSPAMSEDQSAAVFTEEPLLQTVDTPPASDGQSLIVLEEDSEIENSAQPAVPSDQTGDVETDSSSDFSVSAVPDAAVPSPSSAQLPADHSLLSGRNVGEITANAVRLRSGPGTTYSILGTFDKGTRLVVSGVTDGWDAVTIENSSGYVHSDYIRILSDTELQVPQNTDAAGSSGTSAADPASFRVKDGYIVGSSVRLRESPSMTAPILAELKFGTSVKMTGLSGDWTKVIFNGQEGFVSSAFVTEGTFEPATKVNTAKGTALGKEIAAYALNYVGTPYRWGGNNPATGFDCSGFVQYVFSQFGYTTSRVANDVTSDGVHVDPADIQPGDVLCFYSGNNYVGHVGIYIGDNMFVHAANSNVGVVTTSLSTGYYSSRGYEIRRII